MTSDERWPYLNLLAGHILYLGEPADFQEIDRMELDRTESQLRAWIQDVAGGQLDHASLKERIRVMQHHRYPEAPDASGLQAWLDYVFVFDRTEVLIEEVLSVPQPVGEPAIRIRRFRRCRFADCSDVIQQLFTDS